MPTASDIISIDISYSSAEETEATKKKLFDFINVLIYLGIFNFLSYYLQKLKAFRIISFYFCLHRFQFL